MRRAAIWAVVLGAILAVGYGVYQSSRSSRPAVASPVVRGVLTIDYPANETLFPPDIAAPRFRWTDDSPGAVCWQIEARFGDGASPLVTESPVSHWTPTDSQWQTIKSHSATDAAAITICGLSSAGQTLARASVSIRTSVDPVGASLFYREVPLPFSEAVKDPSRIRWRFGSISSPAQPPIVLQGLPVCGNCHSFSADGRQFGMDVDYANDKGSYVVSPVEPQITLDPDRIITWSDYKRGDKEPTFGLLSQISPDGRYVVSTVKDRSVFVATADLEFSQLFFPIKGILVIYDRQERKFFPLPGADDPKYVQSNAVWSPDGREIVFARNRAYQLRRVADSDSVLLTAKECAEFLEEGKTFLFDLYRVPFNGGRGGRAVPVEGAAENGMSNYFPKFSPDGKWIVFCQAKSFMLLQPDSRLYILPAAGGQARPMECNTHRMNSWHTWSPNSRWLAFTSKANGPYSQIFLTHVDPDGRSSPPVAMDHLTAPDRAANIPEFVNLPPDAIQKIVEQFVDDHSHWRAGGRFAKAKDWDNAERLFRKALEVNPRSVEARCSLARMFVETRRFEDTRQELDAALAVDPKSGDAHVGLGDLFFHQRKLPEALQQYRAALAAEPGHATANSQAGAILMLLNRSAEAVPYLKRAVELRPENWIARCNLGRALLGLGKSREAVGYLEQVLELVPKSAEVQCSLADAYAADGRLPEAIAAAEKGLALATAARQTEIVHRIRLRLEQYRAALDGSKGAKP